MTEPGPDPASPSLSLVVLSWENLALTRRCVESLRDGTDVDSELIIVDNGSRDGSAEYASEHADKAVLLEANEGFAKGMNAGLRVATGEYVAFINNDTVFPSGWAAPLITDFNANDNAGIVLPAVTAAGNPVTVRDAPGEAVIVMLPFGEFPSGVVYLLRADVMRALGGWQERYGAASAEDLDLAFTVWAHGLDVILDERVLVEHVSQASVKRLPDRKELYRDNLSRFLDRWESAPIESPLLPSVDRDELLRNQERARTAVVWIRRMLEARARTHDEGVAGPASVSRKRRWLRSRS